jgi:uncharacterized secreted protein with C-terminal beta-propeller domain
MKRGFPVFGALAIVAVMLIALVAIPSFTGTTATPTPTVGPSPFPQNSAPPTGDLKSFSSFDEINSFLSSAASGRNYGNNKMFRGGTQGMPLAEATMDSSGATSGGAGAPPEYSGTNVQVAGVDEADILKTDGTYFYTITQGKIVILKAYPATDAAVVATIDKTTLSSTDSTTYSQIFINGNTLVAFGTSQYNWQPVIDEIVTPIPEPTPVPTAEVTPFVTVEPTPVATADATPVATIEPTPVSEATATPTDGTEPSAKIDGDIAVGATGRMIAPGYYPYWGGSQVIDVYDVSDKTKPKLLKSIDIKGNIVAARMIGNKVYGIYNDYAYSGLPMPLYAVDGAVAKVMPSEIAYVDYPFDSYSFTTVLGLDLSDLQKSESRKIVLTGGASTVFVSKDNAYVTYTQYARWSPVWQAYDEALSGIYTDETRAKLQAISLSDASDWRKDNLRVQVASEFLSADVSEKESAELWGKIYEREQQIRGSIVNTEMTQIHKFTLGEPVTYAGKGEVPGSVINQFAMDESDGYFRIATTTQAVWPAYPMPIRGGGGGVAVGGGFADAGGVPPAIEVTQETAVEPEQGIAVGEPNGGIPDRFEQPKPTVPQLNHVFVLDGNLKVVGKLTDLAPGESIYSVRFMGKRAYLVTFKQLDPLFVIGFDNPTSPQLLGKLKIPGYSNYLHPVDETHLIGFGKDAIPLKESDSAFPLGLKLSLFDVSDVANPVEMATYAIGDAGSESYALQDSHAFLYNPKTGLLVIPVLLAELDKNKYPKPEVHVYGDFKFQGAYVFNVGLDTGFTLRGRVGHGDPEAFTKSGWNYWGSGTEVMRSAYIGEVLYTFSQSKMKANALSDLKELAAVKLPFTEPLYYGGGDVRIE